MQLKWVIKLYTYNVVVLKSPHPCNKTSQACFQNFLHVIHVSENQGDMPLLYE
jgi:hypothetical protein